MDTLILLRLVAAHVLADFPLQFNRLCRAKYKKGMKGVCAQLLHAFIHALTAYMLVAEWKCWLIPLVVFTTHAAIDIIKVQGKSTGAGGFVVDQMAHVAVIVCLWWTLFASDSNPLTILESAMSSHKLWLLIIAYVLVTKPSAILIGKFIQKWTPSNKMQSQGLPRAGEWIGYIERILILTFVLTGNIEGVGFLLAAKSVFRFGDLNQAKEIKITEYVLLGTFASFTVALIVAFVFVRLIARV